MWESSHPFELDLYIVMMWSGRLLGREMRTCMRRPWSWVGMSRLCVRCGRAHSDFIARITPRVPLSLRDVHVDDGFFGLCSSVCLVLEGYEEQ